jgi:tagatose 1,6-diphosphate aldolase
MGFRFLDPGPMIDGELELVAPEHRWVDALLTACSHPQSADDPGASATTRERVSDFLRVAPRGHQPADNGFSHVPSYHFWMKLSPVCAADVRGGPLPRWGAAMPPVQIAGGLSLRIGNNRDLEMYTGHIGYNVYPPARGHHYAERSCRMLFPLARAHGIRILWITCNPDNWASRRTCERLGCHLADIVPVPSDHPLYLRGDREKCRYWISI